MLLKSSDVLRNRLESFEHALSLLYKFIILTFLNESKNIANDKALVKEFPRNSFAVSHA